MNRVTRLRSSLTLGVIGGLAVWHVSLVGMVEREFLSNAISNSPIVDKADVDTFFAGLYYQF